MVVFYDTGTFLEHLMLGRERLGNMRLLCDTNLFISIPYHVHVHCSVPMARAEFQCLVPVPRAPSHGLRALYPLLRAPCLYPVPQTAEALTLGPPQRPLFTMSSDYVLAACVDCVRFSGRSTSGPRSARTGQ